MSFPPAPHTSEQVTGRFQSPWGPGGSLPVWVVWHTWVQAAARGSPGVHASRGLLEERSPTLRMEASARRMAPFPRSCVGEGDERGKGSRLHEPGRVLGCGVGEGGEILGHLNRKGEVNWRDRGIGKVVPAASSSFSGAPAKSACTNTTRWRSMSQHWWHPESGAGEGILAKWHKMAHFLHSALFPSL